MSVLGSNGGDRQLAAEKSGWQTPDTIMQTQPQINILCFVIMLLLPACSHETGTQYVTLQGPYRFAAAPAGLDGPAAQCVVCHSIERGGPLRVAPNLWGIVGDKKARFAWYGYSQALATAEGNWTEEDLDAYLSDPNEYLPGTSKALTGISDAEERAKLIDYLKTLQD